MQRLLDVVGDLANGEISYSPKPRFNRNSRFDQLAALLNGAVYFHTRGNGRL